jgi:hypothetical protein
VIPVADDTGQLVDVQVAGPCTAKPARSRCTSSAEITIPDTPAGTVRLPVSK